MREKAFANVLAGLIANENWTEQAVAERLAAGLPSKFRRQAHTIAADAVHGSKMPYAPDKSRLARIIAVSGDFDTLFKWFAKSGRWPKFSPAQPQMCPVAALADLPVPPLASVGALAGWLGQTVAQLDYFADVSDRVAVAKKLVFRHYDTILLPKKSGGFRLIEAPKARLKALQRQILHGILDKLPAHADAFGFVAGRDCRRAANRHCGEAAVLGFDLQDFFSSVPAPRVHAVFRCMGFPHAVARLLTGLLTTSTDAEALADLPARQRGLLRSRHLPQGAPTSPALANAAAFGLDRRLSALAKHIGANYSRYADDITFSGERAIVRTLAGLVPEIIRDEGFAVNPGKTRFGYASQRQVVTGLTVNSRVNVSRKDFDRLKAVIHACAKPGDGRLGRPAFLNRLQGQIGWVEAVNPVRGQKLRDKLEQAWLARTET